MMRTYLIGVRREFWENQGSFVILPLAITAILIILCSYIVIMHATKDSKFGMAVFGQFYHGQGEPEEANGARINFTGDTNALATSGDTSQAEYIVDFEQGKLTPVVKGELDAGISDNRQFIFNGFLHAIHMIFLNIMGIVLIGYLLNSLYSDRQDRSVLFWKSMPVSETRNVLTKVFVATFAVPVFATVISWLAQIGYILLALLFFYRLGLDPWVTVWSHLEILQAFFKQIEFVLWAGVWMLPFTAWLLFASAWAKRVPFLVAVIPFVVVIVFEYLLFDTLYLGGMLLEHFRIISVQMNSIMQEVAEGIRYGSIDLTLAAPRMITGLIITGLLLPAIIWLRNHRFEI